MDFSAKLIKLREDSGLNQSELAREIGVSRNTVSQWEMGNHKPDAESLYKLSQYFEVSIEYLMGY